MSFWFSNPWQIALVSAYWIWLSIPAWCVFAVRVLTRRVTAKELLLMGAFAICVAAEMFQLSAEAGAGPFAAREHWSLSRYFGVFGPLLWIWAAIGLRILWQLPQERLRAWCRVFAVVWPVVLLFWQTVPFFADSRNAAPRRTTGRPRRRPRGSSAGHGRDLAETGRSSRRSTSTIRRGVRRALTTGRRWRGGRRDSPRARTWGIIRVRRIISF